ncbi:ABC transporter ATP-binding protein [Nakamurella aerolata]|uniref:ABC transporter ATP-binding protein n=1 Tax=Nakamurella aerolata TaxID=1656892 RepID=A0A849A730_9ACTN|nr:ABC transporter ATP-binding protein [Nakamurella aerolata]NNG35847.1 ABC transporter ATP-binding protein [Nakamurella aerolata]
MGADAELVIEMRDVDKSFGSVHALNKLNLQVRRGEVHGFLGPNGAGKSTAIRVLLGLLHADAGRSRLLGGDPWTDAVSLHRRLAYVPGDVTLWPSLTGGEVIDLLTSLRSGRGAPTNAGRRDELIERFQLDPKRKCRTYSKGNRQKVAIIAALASEVELLVLDEPTSGLDPLMEAVFQQCIRQAVGSGSTVLLSSHILSEVESLGDRVSIIAGGTVVESGTLAQLRHLTRTSVQAQLDRVPAGLSELPGVHDLRVEHTRVSLSVDSNELGKVLAALTSAGVQTLTSRPPTLEELFLRHYDQPGDPAPSPSADQQ